MHFSLMATATMEVAITLGVCVWEILILQPLERSITLRTSIIRIRLMALLVI